MFKYLLISIVIVPVLLGIFAARKPNGRLVLGTSFVVYGILWVALLYFLKRRWVG